MSSTKTTKTKTASTASTAAPTKTAASASASASSLEGISPINPLKRSYANASAVPAVCYADEFDASTIQISQICNSKSKIRSFNINTTDGNRVLIQLDGGGRIPSRFGVDVTENGKTYLRLTITDKAEMKAMLAVPDAVLPQVIAGKDVYWAKKVTEDAVRSNFNRVFANAPQPKEDGSGEWAGSIKMMIPMDETGALRKSVSIVDHDGSNVDIADLPGRKYASCIFELGVLYCMGSKSGITKKVVALQLEKIDNRFEAVTFLPKRARKAE